MRQRTEKDAKTPIKHVALPVGDNDGTDEGSKVIVGAVGTDGVGAVGGLLSLSSLFSFEDEEDDELPPPLVAKYPPIPPATPPMTNATATTMNHVLQ